MIYAVNKRTKEHRVVVSNAFVCEEEWYRENGWRIIQADAEGWIEWSGGECPLPDNVRYKTIHASGYVFDGNCPQTFTNHWIGHEDPVVKYRPILDDDKPQAPEWNGEGLPPAGTCVEVRRNDNDWPVVKVVTHDDGGIIYRDPSTTDHRYKWAIGSGIRPIRTAREKWIDQAAEMALQTGDALGNVYDALKSGELPRP